MSKLEMIKSYCLKCRGETNHLKLFEKIDSVEVREADVYFSYTYMVLSCAGCEKVTYRTDYDDRDNVEYDNEGNVNNYTDTTIYPHAIKNHRRLENIYYLPSKLRVLYEECIESISVNSKVLAVAGLRAIVEGACADQGIKGKNLKAKITKLASDGVISKNDARRLHSIRFMGNDAVHKLESVDDNKLMLVLQIIEHLLSALYILDQQAERLLEVPINNFSAFKRLLRSSIKNSKLLNPEPLKVILGSAFRQVEDDIDNFENLLKEEIAAGSFGQLIRSGIKEHPHLGNVEHYEIVKKERLA